MMAADLPGVWLGKQGGELAGPQQPFQMSADQAACHRTGRAFSNRPARRENPLKP